MRPPVATPRAQTKAPLRTQAPFVQRPPDGYLCGLCLAFPPNPQGLGLRVVLSECRSNEPAQTWMKPIKFLLKARKLKARASPRGRKKLAGLIGILIAELRERRTISVFRVRRDPRAPCHQSAGRHKAGWLGHSHRTSQKGGRRPAIRREGPIRCVDAFAALPARRYYERQPTDSARLSRHGSGQTGSVCAPARAAKPV